MFFERGGHVDVAPVFIKSTDVYLLPSGGGSWIPTSPFIANKWFADKNAELSYNLAPLVRLLKKWNVAHSKRLRSFHLETMAGHTFSSLNSNGRAGLQKFFEWASSHLDVNDPGGQSGLLSGYLTWNARGEVSRSFEVAADRATKAIEAEDSGNHEEARDSGGSYLETRSQAEPGGAPDRGRHGGQRERPGTPIATARGKVLGGPLSQGGG